MKLHEAIEVCRASGLEGVELIQFAQKLVGTWMNYSYSNSFDFPSRALERGKGYCWQQASILNRILVALGFQSRLVYAVRTVMPQRVHGGTLVAGHISGHVWCRVRYGDREGDVCPGNPENRFGKVHFVPVSAVRRWNGWVCFWAYWGSAWVNAVRRRRVSR
ncbi:transglutaminase domain-containing protein [Paenibacillus mesotrionivorans]|jgi:hypothetical protein|uniref:Transglutaminase domain-containing protein n=1 Tax=Paenibacillus mesotrionivorans TaxID=3160968 RepID=A0ACC7NT80_9BACL